MSPPLWERMTCEERALEIVWAIWVTLAFLGAPVAWLVYWLAA